MLSTPFVLFGAYQDAVSWVEGTKLWMPWCIPPKHGTALWGLHGWMHVFGSTGGCMECQAQDCCVGSCSTGSNCDQTQRGLRRCITIVRQTPWGSVKQHSWRCWSITSPGSVTELPRTLKTAASFLCESPLPSQLFAFPQSSAANGSWSWRTLCTGVGVHEVSDVTKPL